MEKIFKTYNETNTINTTDKTLINVISSAVIDRDNDIIIPELIDDTNYSKSPVVLFQHNSNNVIGKSLWRKVDGNNYISKTQFANTSLAKEVFSLYKDGFLTSFSIGFIPLENPTYNPDTNIRTFGKIEMLEYSAVSIPANPNAVTLSFIKELKSDELVSEYIKNYVIVNIENDLIALKKEIDILKSENLKIEEIKNNYNDLQKKINDIIEETRVQKEIKDKIKFKEDLNRLISQKLSK